MFPTRACIFNDNIPELLGMLDKVRKWSNIVKEKKLNTKKVVGEVYYETGIKKYGLQIEFQSSRNGAISAIQMDIKDFKNSLFHEEVMMTMDAVDVLITAIKSVPKFTKEAIQKDKESDLLK